jgi:hypothetical protein
MTVRELSSRIEKFRAELEEHVKLWGESLDNTFPEYPIRNHERIRKQYDSLARQLGTLRPYFNRLGLPSIMGNAYGQWDAYDSAVSDDVAVRKGSSIQAVLSQLLWPPILSFRYSRNTYMFDLSRNKSPTSTTCKAQIPE